MNPKYFWIVVIAFGMLAASCKNDSDATGNTLYGQDEQIWVRQDTLTLNSSVKEAANIISSPDSFLLGEMESSHGIVRAEILTQLACPVGFRYPENAEVDSVCLFMYYRTWIGDGRTPLELDVKQMDLQTLKYSQTYESDIAIDEYVSSESKSILANRRIILANIPQDSTKTSSGARDFAIIRARTTDDFCKQFFATRAFDSQEAFNDLFNGLYITSTFGGSTILNISDIAMAVYYHFSYDKAGRDTTVSDMKGFYANDEVRQINRIEYAGKDIMVEHLQQDTDFNYVIAPAGVYTQIQIPIKKLALDIYKNLVKDNGDMKRPYVNMARVSVQVDNVYDGGQEGITKDDWAQPAQTMMLIKESALNSFFKNKNLPVDTLALISNLVQSADSLGNYVYYYSYDLSALLTEELRTIEKQQMENGDVNPEDISEVLNMALVPVNLRTNNTNSGTVTIGVQQAQSLSTTKIMSGKNRRALLPLSLEVVYSGF